MQESSFEAKQKAKAFPYESDSEARETQPKHPIKQNPPILKPADVWRIALNKSEKEKYWSTYQTLLFQDSDEVLEFRCDEQLLSQFGVKCFDIFNDPGDKVTVLGIGNSGKAKDRFCFLTEGNSQYKYHPYIYNCSDLLAWYEPLEVQPDFFQRAWGIKRAVEHSYKLISELLAKDFKSMKLVFKYFEQSYEQKNWRFILNPDWLLGEPISNLPLFYRLHKTNSEFLSNILERFKKLEEKKKRDFPSTDPINFDCCIYHAFENNDIAFALLFTSGLKAGDLSFYDSEELLDVLRDKESLLIELLIRGFFNLEEIIDLEIEGVSETIKTYEVIMSSFDKTLPEGLVVLQKRCLKYRDMVLKFLYGLISNNLLEENPAYDFKVIKKFLVIFKKTYGEIPLLSDILHHLYCIDFDTINNKTFFKDNQSKIKFFEKNFKKITNKLNLINGDNSQLKESIKKDKTELIPLNKTDMEDVDLSVLIDYPEFFMALIQLEVALQVPQGVAIGIFMKFDLEKILKIPNIVGFMQSLKSEATNGFNEFLAHICHMLGRIYYSRGFLGDSASNFLCALKYHHYESLSFLIKILDANLDKSVLEKIILGLQECDLVLANLDNENLELLERKLSSIKDLDQKRFFLFLGKIYIARDNFSAAEKYLFMSAVKGCFESFKLLLDHPKMSKKLAITAYLESSQNNLLNNNYLKNIPSDNFPILESSLKELYLEKSMTNQDFALMRSLIGIYKELILSYSRIDLIEDLLLSWQKREGEDISVDIEEILMFKEIPSTQIAMAKFYVKSSSPKKQLQGLELVIGFINHDLFGAEVKEIFHSVDQRITKALCEKKCILPQIEVILLEHYNPELDYQYCEISNQSRLDQYLSTIDVIQSTLKIDRETAAELLAKTYINWESNSNIGINKFKIFEVSAHITILKIFRNMKRLEKYAPDNYFSLCFYSDLGKKSQDCIGFRVTKVTLAMLKFYKENIRELSFHQILDEFIKIAKQASENKGMRFFNFDHSNDELNKFYTRIASIAKPESCEILTIIDMYKKNTSISPPI